MSFFVYKQGVVEDDGEEQHAAEHSHIPQRSAGIETEARPDLSMLLGFTGSYCLAQCFLCAAETYSAPQVGAKLNKISFLTGPPKSASLLMSK